MYGGVRPPWDKQLDNPILEQQGSVITYVD